MLETGNKRRTERSIAAFFGKNYAYFFAPLIALVAYTVVLACYGVFPFGEAYTVASYDLSAQICPFIEHLFDVLDGKSSLFYSYAIAGGADVTGTFLYFFISPFSFLFLIFGDGMVAQASGLVVACKLAAIAFAGTWFAKSLFKDIPDYLCITVGLAYAYCGYTFVSNTYINWMDFLIYMPFAVWAFRRFVNTRSFWLFSLFMACCIYTCFSIACFSMFVVFPTLIFYGLLCVEKDKRNGFLARLCIAFFAAILMALPVLTPALAAYLRSGRGGGIFDNLWFGFEMDGTQIGDFSSSAFIDTVELAAYRKWSYILTDSAFVFLTLVWFLRKGLRDPFAKFMLAAGVFTLLPVAVDEVTLLMNMGSYMSYALRFGFLNAIYFLGGACLGLEGLCFAFGRAYDGTSLQTVKTFTGGRVYLSDEPKQGGRYALNGWGCFFIALGAACVCFLLWFISSGNWKNFWSSILTDSEMLEGLESFSGRFAHSLGGAEVICVPFILVGVATLVGAGLVRGKKVSLRLVSLVMVGVVGAQLLFYNDQIVVGNRSTQHIDIESFQTVGERLLKDDDSYFRVKDYGDQLTANATFTAGVDSFSVFSSVIDADNFVVGELFGYKGNFKNSLKSAHSDGKYNRCDEFGDSFLGYKYYLVAEEDRSKIENDHKLSKYIKPYIATGEATQLSVGGYYVYENEIVFPSAYKVSGGTYRFVAENIADSGNRAKNQAALYEFLRGKSLQEMRFETGSNSSEYVTVETARELSEYLWKNAAEMEVGAGKIFAKVTATAGERLFLNFVASKGYRPYVNGKEKPLVDNDLNFLCVELDEGENVVEFVYESPYPVYVLVGAGVGLLGLCAVAVVERKTKWIDNGSGVIAWAGVLLVAAVIAFFMVFPTAVGAVKLARLCL